MSILFGGTKRSASEAHLDNTAPLKIRSGSLEPATLKTWDSLLTSAEKFFQSHEVDKSTRAWHALSEMKREDEDYRFEYIGKMSNYLMASKKPVLNYIDPSKPFFFTHLTRGFATTVPITKALKNEGNIIWLDYYVPFHSPYNLNYTVESNKELALKTSKERLEKKNMFDPTDDDEMAELQKNNLYGNMYFPLFDRVYTTDSFYFGIGLVGSHSFALLMWTETSGENKTLHVAVFDPDYNVRYETAIFDSSAYVVRYFLALWSAHDDHVSAFHNISEMCKVTAKGVHCVGYIIQSNCCAAHSLEWLIHVGVRLQNGEPIMEALKQATKHMGDAIHSESTAQEFAAFQLRLAVVIYNALHRIGWRPVDELERIRDEILADIGYDIRGVSLEDKA
jgi:hypothetical protein